tara:strand:- start:4741 stop:4848 length:108 start_codon:yes stop_codon:yes gene_type:complete
MPDIQSPAIFERFLEEKKGYETNIRRQTKGRLKYR